MKHNGKLTVHTNKFRIYQSKQKSVAFLKLFSLFITFNYIPVKMLGVGAWDWMLMLWTTLGSEWQY